MDGHGHAIAQNDGIDGDYPYRRGGKAYSLTRKFKMAANLAAISNIQIVAQEYLYLVRIG